MFKWLEKYIGYSGDRDKEFLKVIGVSPYLFRLKMKRQMKNAYITVAKILLLDRRVYAGYYGLGLVIYTDNKGKTLETDILEEGAKYVKGFVNREIDLEEIEKQILKDELIKEEITYLKKMTFEYMGTHYYVNVIPLSTSKLKDKKIPRNMIIPIYVQRRGNRENVGVVRNYQD